MAEVFPAYVALGSNLDHPIVQIRRAIKALSGLRGTRLCRQSGLYGSQPMGPSGQPDYVNAVVLLETTLSPLELLDLLQDIERQQGRIRGKERWGPRTIDLDLLIFGDLVIEESRLTVPHPGMHERDFVLYPLAEIAPPQLMIPGLSRLSVLLAQCPSRGLRPLERADEPTS